MVIIWEEIENVINENRHELVVKGNKELIERIESSNGLMPVRLYDMLLVNYLDLSALPIIKLDDRLSHLTNLTQLSIKQSSLTHLPNTICDLKMLKLLNVSYSSLVELPENIGNLKGLHSLNVSHNCLKTFPDSLSNCSFLSVVNFSNNQFTEFPLMMTEGDVSLKVAEVNGSYNEITEVHDSIENLTSLKDLDLSNNKIVELPKAIAKCIKLKQVNFKTNALKEKRLKKLIEQAVKCKTILDYIRLKGADAKGGKAPKGKAAAAKGKQSRKEMKDAHTLAANNTDDLVKYFIEVMRVDESPWAEDETPFRVTVTEEVREVRPYIVGCILKNIDLEKKPGMFKSFLTLQTRLHEEICGRRTIATIATHDMEKLKGSTLIYDAKHKKSFKICPLGRQKRVTAEKLFLRLYEEAEAARKENKRNQITGIHKYLSLVKDEDVYAFLRRSVDDKAISLHPLTNCEETKVTPTTTDIFVEVTGTKSLPKCKEIMDEFLKQLIEKGFTSTESEEDVDDEAKSSSEPKLIVQQVRCEDEEGTIRCIYPSKNDIANPKPQLKVLRP